MAALFCKGCGQSCEWGARHDCPGPFARVDLPCPKARPNVDDLVRRLRGDAEIPNRNEVADAVVALKAWAEASERQVSELSVALLALMETSKAALIEAVGLCAQAGRDQ